MTAQDRAALALAKAHGIVSVEAYSFAFDTLVGVLEISDTVHFARTVMSWRMQLAAGGSEEALHGVA
jgi:hypothetical protein